MNKHDREPTINSFTKYAKAFSLTYSEVDAQYQPTVKSTIACFINGLYPKSFRDKIKNEDPPTLQAVDALARKEVQSLNESNDKLKQYKYNSESYNYGSSSYYNKNNQHNSYNDRDRDRRSDSNYHSNQQHQQYRGKDNYKTTLICCSLS